MFSKKIATYINLMSILLIPEGRYSEGSVQNEKTESQISSEHTTE